VATPIKFRTEVIRVIQHAPDVATFEFRYLDRHPRYKPGQFLHLALDAYDPAGHWPESRAFTIAKGSTDPEFIRLTISAKGRFTHHILSELTVGRQIWMKAPYGDFIVHASPEHEVVLIAGGTGVTPFVAFMEDVLARGLSGEVWLHYGARRPDLLVFRELAARCGSAFPNFHARFYAESEANDGIIPGQIDLGAACQSLRCRSEAVFYLCGPPQMIDACSARLRSEFAVAETNIRMDQWE
jgi:ferredoxin-NADP reductase